MSDSKTECVSGAGAGGGTMSGHDVMRSTAAHIRRVGELLAAEANELVHRAVEHDASKWSAAEWPGFEAETPRLGAAPYGSDAYRAALGRLQPTLEHHYRKNRHHPEHHGAPRVESMTLVDLIEMLCDWKAAGERPGGAGIRRSLEAQRLRYGIGTDLFLILARSAHASGWLPEEQLREMTRRLPQEPRTCDGRLVVCGGEYWAIVDTSDRCGGDGSAPASETAVHCSAIGITMNRDAHPEDIAPGRHFRAACVDQDGDEFTVFVGDLSFAAAWAEREIAVRKAERARADVEIDRALAAGGASVEERAS